MEGICFNDEEKQSSSFLPAVIRPEGFHPSADAGRENEIMRVSEREREIGIRRKKRRDTFKITALRKEKVSRHKGAKSVCYVA